MATTPEQIDTWFEYLDANHSMINKIENVYRAARIFAHTLYDMTPSGADQTAAMRKIREATWTAIDVIVRNDES